MSIETFVKKVEKTSKKACDYGEMSAIAHYVNVSGVSKEEAEAFYVSMRSVLKDSLTAIRCQTSSLQRVLSSGRFALLTDRTNVKRQQCEKLIGCEGFGTLYADCRNSTSSICEDNLLVIDPVKEGVCFNGELVRLRNSERSDYVTDPELLLYSMEHIADCKASSMICGITMRDAAMGSDKLLEMTADKQYEVGHCQILMFFEPKLENLRSIECSSEADAVLARKYVSALDIVIPVHVSELSKTHFPSVGTNMHFETDEKIPTTVMSRYMRIGDRVALKPLPTQPRMTGKVIASDGSSLTVHWDDDSRGIYDAAEALMRLMPAPTSTVAPSFSETPIMDVDSCKVLAVHGIDANTLYSLLSHLKPSSDKHGGWKEKVIGGLSRFGLNAKEVSGFVPGSTEFLSANWIEASLPSGGRLVVDMSADRLKVSAGDADDYIVPISAPNVNIE